MASAQQTDAPAGPTPGLRPADEQATSSAAGQAGTGAAGKQAAVGAGGEGLTVQPMLPPADAIPADATQNSAHPAAQPARKRSRKHRDLDESGTGSCDLPAMGAPSECVGMSRACQSLCGCDGTWACLTPSAVTLNWQDPTSHLVESVDVLAFSAPLHL